MFHKILVDESVDYRIVKILRKNEFQVISILEDYRSVSDKVVLDLARENSAILLTEDKDFGEWVFAYHEKGVGVILLRYQPEHLEQIIESLFSVLRIYGDSLASKFAVITVKKIRIREI